MPVESAQVEHVASPSTAAVSRHQSRRVSEGRLTDADYLRRVHISI
jgi:hypothetical protein